MKRAIISLLFAALILTGTAVAQDNADIITKRDTPPSPNNIQLEQIIRSLIRPLFITHANDGSDRLFIVEQRGRIYVRDGGAASIFLDISSRVSPEASGIIYTERGLLGLAFHPDYAENGTFFVNYTDRNGDTVIRRYQVSEDPNVADTRSGTDIFFQTQPYPNHNGGHMAFGPDGYLYVSLGDGGLAGDPLAEGQNPQGLLGSILRLDVNTETGYAIPADNPFASGGAGAPEVWAYGLRNAWRFSFDRATGDLYLGDVGQNQWEEINFEPAGSPGGLNYGWNAYEATHPYSGQRPNGEVVMPIAEYDHSQGCSVTGGYVYRGEAIPDLQGVYLYSDYCTGNVWYAYRDLSNNWQSGLFMETGFQVSSFGEGQDGELYIMDYGGAVYKIVPAQ